MTLSLVEIWSFQLAAHLVQSRLTNTIARGQALEKAGVRRLFDSRPPAALRQLRHVGQPQVVTQTN